jgi:tRNA(Arg) A34 adenosine deaminase TadA
MKIPEIDIVLPPWLAEVLADAPPAIPEVEARMRWVITLARLNVEKGTGGPFAAAVFERGSNAPVAAGVNMVLLSGCSILHAEIVAVMAAQKLLGHYHLSSEPGRSFELVSSCEPCAMCFGALQWAGLAGLVCGAREEDARRIGFDEGDKVADWPLSLGRRGIAVQRDICRSEAAAVLDLYIRLGGAVYNGGKGRDHPGEQGSGAEGIR